MLKVRGFVLLMVIAFVSGNAREGKPVVCNTQFPYMASIQITRSSDGQNQALCAGTIVSQQHILTSATCAVSQIVFGYPTVVVGTRNSDQGGQRYNVSAHIIPQDAGATTNNVALIYLSQPIQFSESVQPIPIAGFNPILAGTPAILAHWSCPNVESELHYSEATIAPYDTCDKDHPWFYKNMRICTLVPTDSPCINYIGAALVVEGRIAGIGRINMRDGETDLFLRTDKNGPWIKEHVRGTGNPEDVHPFPSETPYLQTLI